MKFTVKSQCNIKYGFFIMGFNEKKNFFVINSKFTSLFKFIQEVDCHITIIFRNQM
jgi:hypothetical protein